MSIPSQEEMQRWYEATGRAPSDLWEAINRYVVTCGGNPSDHVYGNVPRMQAVVDVERAVAANAIPRFVGDCKIYIDSRKAQDTQTWRWACSCGAAGGWNHHDKIGAAVEGERHRCGVEARAALRHLAAEILGYVICDARMAQSPNAYKVMQALRGVLGDETHRRHACEVVARFGNVPTNDPIPRCHVCGVEVSPAARTGLDLGAEPEDAKFCEPCIEAAEVADMDMAENMSTEEVAQYLLDMGLDPEKVGRDGVAIVEAEIARRAAVGKAVDGGE